MWTLLGVHYLAYPMWYAKKDINSTSTHLEHYFPPKGLENHRGKEAIRTTLSYADAANKLY